MKNIIVVTGGVDLLDPSYKLLVKKTKYKIISIDNYSTVEKIILKIKG